MPKPKNTILRVVVPVVLLAVAVLVAWAVLKNTGRPSLSPSPAPGGAPSAPGAQQAPAVPVTKDPTPPAKEPAAQGAPEPAKGAAGAGPAGTPIAKVWSGDPRAGVSEPIGSLDQRGKVLLRLEFSPLGAGIRSVKLARHVDGDGAGTSAEIQHAIEPQLVPMAALGVYVNGTFVNLVGTAEAPVWRGTGEAGGFEAQVVDGAGAPWLGIERRYEIAPDTYVVGLRQTVKNLTQTPVKVSWVQQGPIDLPGEISAYGGDKRRVRFGFLLDPTADPTRRAVVSNDFIQDHAQALGTPDKGTGNHELKVALWPNAKATTNGYQLVWTALTNRYFGVAVHPYGEPGAGPLPAFPVAGVDRLVLDRYRADASGKQTLDPVMALRLTSPEASLAGGERADFSLGVYAGPTSHHELRTDPVASQYGLDGMVLFNFGGPCGFCTFGGITSTLFWLMHVLHDYLVHDWALAIILLVVCVRTVLHPLTKWSQVRMQRFGKQMQGMAPKQKQIQERYRDDKKRLQEEMAKLWREEGVSPMGMLGCLPMFLMTPVWIALYAMLYFAFELRHQPAFFGVFQHLVKGWAFLADLAEPDRFYYFGRVVVTLPMLGAVQSINILPLILGCVFFVHQKYLTPPTTSTMTPEQEMQQKMVKIMSVVMFPLLMYNAPSGLAIYFIANSTLAIFENKYIRAHIDKYDLMNTKGKGKPTGGFVGRLMKAAEERARLVEQAGRKPGKGGRG